MYQRNFSEKFNIASEYRTLKFMFIVIICDCHPENSHTRVNPKNIIEKVSRTCQKLYQLSSQTQIQERLPEFLADFVQLGFIIVQCEVLTAT